MRVVRSVTNLLRGQTLRNPLRGLTPRSPLGVRPSNRFYALRRLGVRPSNHFYALRVRPLNRSYAARSVFPSAAGAAARRLAPASTTSVSRYGSAWNSWYGTAVHPIA